MVHHTIMKERKGIVLAGGSGSRLYPLTIAVSKQLQPVFDKPMIYYPLSVLMLAGIREILIISTPEDRPLFERLLGDGSQWGVSLAFAEQPRPEGLAQAYHIGREFLDGAPSALILGDNLFYGHNFADTLLETSRQDRGATIFGYSVSNPQDYGVVEFDERGNVLSIEEKPEHPASHYAIPGVYFYDQHAPEHAETLTPSARGEFEITDLNRVYLDRGELRVSLLGRGTAWLDTGTHASLLDAGNFIKTIETRQGLKIACLEEIAFSRGWIDEPALSRQIERMGKSGYAAYLRQLLAAPDRPRNPESPSSSPG